MKKTLTFFFVLLISLYITAVPKWTVMVYMCGDNDLEYFSYLDMDEMEMVGSTDDSIEIVVLWDRIPGYASTTPTDWDGTRIYHISKHPESGVNSSYIDSGEVDMGDPQTAVDFIRHCRENYEAENYMMVFWDHGDGWYEGIQSDADLERSVCNDDTSYNSLSTGELKEILKEGEEILGKKISITGFDACLMQMIEVGYEIREHTDYILASQQTEPGGGWPYEKVLESVVDYPDSPEVIIEKSVQYYIASYEDPDTEISDNELWNVTLSGIRTEKIPELTEKIKDFVSYAKKNMAQMTMPIRKMLDNVTVYDLNQNVDMYHMFALMAEELPNGEAKDMCIDIMDSIYDVVVYNMMTENHPNGWWWDSEGKANYYYDVSNSHGISIYFPKMRKKYYTYTYKQLEFSEDTDWDELLDIFFSKEPKKNMRRVTLRPEEVRFIKAEKIGGEPVYPGYYTPVNPISYIWSEITDIDTFNTGKAPLIGNFQAYPYQDEWYEMYIYFDLENIFTAEFDNETYYIKPYVTDLTNCNITIWGQNRLRIKDCISYLTEPYGTVPVAEGNLKKLHGVNIEGSSLDGESLLSFFREKIRYPQEFHGFIVGHGTVGTDCGYYSDIDPERITLNFEFFYNFD